MKRKTVFLFVVLLLCSVSALHGQLIRFTNFDRNTRLVNGSIFTVKYELDSVLAKDALYLQMVQHAFGSRYTIPAFTCYMPPFPHCAKEFGLIVSAPEGLRINLIAYSYLTQTRGIIDSSEYATVISQTSVAGAVQDNTMPLFPNPARTYVTLVLPPPEMRPCVVTVFAIDGREIYRYTAQPKAEHVSFDVAALANGAYAVRVETPREVNVWRFIIQH